ncbi:MAG: hypothetical protein ACRD42_03225 [Nitrososphaeraceae archaeon]
MNKQGLPIVLAVVFASTIIPLTNVSGDSVNPGVYAPNSSPYGTPYEDWIAKWWQWTMSIPVSEHPRDAYTEEKCGVNQEGPVWFLADQLGGREERTCTIPAGKAVLIPLLTGECDYGIPEVKNDEGLRRCTMAGNEYGTIDAVVDGVKIKNLEKYRTQSGFFNISIPKDNIYEAPAGNFRAMADGFFVFLEPLPAGQHEADLKVSVLNPVESSYNYNADWTYHLMTEPSKNSTGQ